MEQLIHHFMSWFQYSFRFTLFDRRLLLADSLLSSLYSKSIRSVPKLGWMGCVTNLFYIENTSRIVYERFDASISFLWNTKNIYRDKVNIRRKSFRLSKQWVSCVPMMNSKITLFLEAVGYAIDEEHKWFSMCILYKLNFELV